jgi:hypothetical protein
MRQRETAVDLLSYFEDSINWKVLDRLEEVLGDAQNGPPDGAADGSIDEATWMALRVVVESAKALRHCLGKATLR